MSPNDGSDPYPISVRFPQGSTRSGVRRGLQANYDDCYNAETGELERPERDDNDWAVKRARLRRRFGEFKSVVRVHNREEAETLIEVCSHHAAASDFVWWTPMGAKMLRRVAREVREELPE